jgi:hypothetical protein
MTLNFTYFIALYFILICLFGDRKYIYSAIVLSIASIANFLIIDVLDLTLNSTYTEESLFLIGFDGATALALTFFIGKQHSCANQSIILLIAVFCHFATIYDIQNSLFIITSFIDSYYEQAIILLGLLQMWIARNGIFSAFRNISLLLHNSIDSCVCRISDILKNTAEKIR